MTKIATSTRAALIALSVLMSVAPLAQAKRWHDEDRGDQSNDSARGYDSGSPENNPPRRDRRSRSDNAPQYDGGSRNDNAPRYYSEPRDQPSRGSGISMDSAVAQASREGRVLSADQMDGGYRIKVLTPQGRVRVLYFGGGR